MRNNLEHFGDDGFNALNTGVIIYLLYLCLLPTSWNNRWMDIHDSFRMWKQEGISALEVRPQRASCLRIVMCASVCRWHWEILASYQTFLKLGLGFTTVPSPISKGK